ncbi:MAG: pantoate--beta-alanine ligase [Muribaculaceae bacterium]|nr:pantoate--beta-alanine ligase [Muribaculaceae bacterium]MDE6792675.1 pantoate--beta-alanine ligase [Muribaculaceae bacterium]
MIILRTVDDVRLYVSEQKGRNASIGLVPTMGALHAGHISLVEQAVKDNDVVIASVFVNPTQFNNPDDLATYPRKEEDDFRLLSEAGASAVFAPSVEEIYPGGVEAQAKHEFDLGRAAEVMEGKYRPGHFQGVAQIVSLLFRIVTPDRAYFGEKDFQQIAVIRNMVKSEGIKVEIIACPIKRADDGLALSSRNALLTPEQRMLAPEIHSALKESVEYSKAHSVQATHDSVVERIDALPEMSVEYFEIVDARTLEKIDEWEESPWVVGCITVYCGKVRLIDNIAYRLPN